MTKLYGRSKKGERVVDYEKDQRYERISIVSSVKLDGSTVPLVFEGALNGDLFKEYIERCLCPTLGKDDIVVMDNLSSHKVYGIREAIESKGATIMYLPAYSPDLNPIEEMWSKIKTYLRKVKANTLDDLFIAIGEAFDTISMYDIWGWFSHAGYSLL